MNSFQHDTRVLKACRVSAECSHGETVLVAALGDNGLPVEEHINEQLTVWRPNLKSRHWPRNRVVQLVKYIEWLSKIVRRSRIEKPDVIHAHSLSALPVGIVAKWMTGAPVLYDAHELETEVVGVGSIQRRVSRWVERFFIRWVDQMVTVCDSIANWYVDAYSVEPPFVVRNIPEWGEDVFVGPDVLRAAHDIPEDELILLYQGALSPGRGIERLLSVFDRHEFKSHLVFMGYGALEQEIRERALKSGNVYFQQAVSPDKLLLYTSCADVGICLIEPVSLSNYYSLPNKLFEYLKSGIPLIVSNLPEQEVVIEDYECGWVVTDSDDALVKLLGSLDREAVASRAAGVLAANRNFTWQAEADVLKNAYLAIERDSSRLNVSRK